MLPSLPKIKNNFRSNVIFLTAHIVYPSEKEKEKNKTNICNLHHFK